MKNQCYEHETARTIQAVRSCDGDLKIALVADSHLDNSASATVENIAAVDQAVQFDCCVHLGDFLAGEIGGRYAKLLLRQQLELFQTAVSSGRFFPAQGNHDACSGPYSARLWPEAIGFLDAEQNVRRPAQKPYYYVDIAKEKVRLVFLCSYYYKQHGGEPVMIFGYEESQIHWLQETALNLPADWTVMLYRFRYKNVRGTGWYDGFYLGFSPANIYWSDGGVQVDFNDGSTALHFYKAATEDAEGNPVYQPVLNTAQSPSIVSGQEYEIEFGLLKVSDDTVKVHLTINGTPYFADVEVKDSVFVTKPLYFGIFSRGSEATISSMEYSVVDVTDMLEDTTNWTSAGWGDPLTVADGTVTAKTAEGYSIGGYNKPVKLNTVYRFKYMHKRGSGAAGFAFNFAANDVYWNGGIQVDFNSESAAVHYVEGQNVPVFDADQTFKAEDDMVYDIEFAVLQLAENTVKVYLTINGTPFFTDKNAVENAIFVTKPLYFGIYASSATATISKPDPT